MHITLNGESREVGARLSVLELLKELGLDARVVAVELNREIVSRAKLGELTLGPGDVVEVVQFVGGG